MEQKLMTESEKLLAMAPQGWNATPDYQDDELMIIDTVKILGHPDSIKPNMNIVAFCTQGRLTVMLNDEPLEVTANQIFICPPETRVSNLMVSADFEFVALCITNHAMQHFIRQHISVWNQVLYVKKSRVFSISDHDATFCGMAYELLRMCMREQTEPDDEVYQRDIINGLLSTLLIGLCHLLKRQLDITQEKPQQNVSFFNRFLNLLQKTEHKHRPVEYYASQLFISPKYLTIICKKNSDKTANDWIREYTLADISYYLRNTELSVKEISIKLGFPNTSFFGKYVKEHFGCTPLAYRSKQQ
ncbi:MAG: helix-turn-helix transcriptional regulator [Prevotella sp.]|nr:helix-turn-helix transcriptional regulator [Prevotella sp.]